MEKTKLFNLNNSLVSDIDEYFAFGKFDDMILKFHKPTSYIHARTSAKALGNYEKMAHHFSEWLKNKDTVEFINELEKEIKTTDFLQDTGSKFDEKINSDISTHPSYFLIGNDFAIEFRGYYLHPELFMYFVFWLSKKKAVMYINELLKYQQSLIQKHERIIRNIQYLKGSLKITITENNLKLHPENYNQVSKSSKENTLIIPNIIDSSNYRDKIFNYIELGLSKVFSIGKNRNSFIINAGYTNEQVIEEIQEILKLDEFDISFKFNEIAYKEYLEKYKTNPSSQLLGFIFEFEMSKKYQSHRYSDVPKIYLQKFGLTNKDTGIDLIDIPNKILYQCKYYETKIDISESLQRSRAMLEKFKSVDDNFQLKLIVKKDVLFTRRFMEEFKDTEIIEEEIEDVEE